MPRPWGSSTTVTLTGALLALAPPTVVVQGTHRATLTVHWSRATKEATRGNPDFTALVRSSNETTESLDAVAVFEIPDADYDRLGLAAFSYVGGHVIGPEYEEIGGGPRRKLPVTRLVSFSGRMAQESHGQYVTQAIGTNEPPCEVNTSAKGEGDFAAGRPGAGTGQLPTITFQFTPRSATFALQTMSTFLLKEEANSKCQTIEANTRTVDPLAVNFPIGTVMMPQIMRPWAGEVKRTATGYTGQAQKHEGPAGRTTENVTFTLDLGRAGPTATALDSVQPPLPPPTPPTNPIGGLGPSILTRGQVTFIQGGKEARWQLSDGKLVGMGGLYAAPLSYTPNGRPADPADAQLTLVVVDRGDGASVEQLLVIKGPGGDWRYESETKQCSVHAQRSSSGIQGSVDCRGGAQGALVTKLMFSANP